MERCVFSRYFIALIIPPLLSNTHTYANTIAGSLKNGRDGRSWQCTSIVKCALESKFLRRSASVLDSIHLIVSVEMLQNNTYGSLFYCIYHRRTNAMAHGFSWHPVFHISLRKNLSLREVFRAYLSSLFMSRISCFNMWTPRRFPTSQFDELAIKRKRVGIYHPFVSCFSIRTQLLLLCSAL